MNARDASAAPTALAGFEELRALLEGSVDAAVVLDRERRLVYFNPAYQAATGISGRKLALDPARRPRCCEVMPLEMCQGRCLGERARALGKAMRADEIHARRSDGTELTFIVTASPLPQGYVVEVYRDVTAEARVQREYKALLVRERQANETLERTVGERTEELRAAAEKLRDTQAQLIHQEKMSSLGRLVAGIAHELNNPINFVYGNVEFLGRYMDDVLSLIALYDSCASRLPEEAREQIAARKQEIEFDFLVEDSSKLIQSIRSGAERTAGIVRDLKAFSRTGSGIVQDVDVASGIETTLTLIAPLLKNRVKVIRDFQQPPPRLACHPGHINQVFMNVLTNAAQAIEGEGEIFVSVKQVPGDRVQVVVRDTGKGISPEIMSKIFDPFFTTKEVGVGTGLGLALSDGIVRAHGGTITCESDVRAGSTFIITLPLRPPGESELARGG